MDIVQKWKFSENADNEAFKLLKINDIVTDEGTQDAWIADIFEMGDFMEFLDQEGGPGSDQILNDLPASLQFQEHVAWLNVNKTNEGYQVGYLHGDGVYEKSFMFEDKFLATALKHLKAKVETFSKA